MSAGLPKSAHALARKINAFRITPKCLELHSPHPHHTSRPELPNRVDDQARPRVAAALRRPSALRRVPPRASQDLNIWLPNLFGAVMGTVELTLRLVYGAKPEPPPAAGTHPAPAAAAPAKESDARAAAAADPAAAGGGGGGGGGDPSGAAARRTALSPLGDVPLPPGASEPHQLVKQPSSKHAG
jgi:hypothetical protein